MKVFVNIMMKVNVFLYRLTNGWIGGRMAGNSVLLLNSIGRKSGKLHTIPINYFRDGDNYLVVGSNWGKDNHPGWFFNLKSRPDTTIQIGNRVIQVHSYEVDGDEYERLWKFVTAQNNFYVNYQAHTNRNIPIVILTLMK
jgi:F420H(2)-dependent quinone reductase